MKKLHILFPSSFFNKNAVDEDFAGEYVACVETGLFNVTLFSYEAWVKESRLVLTACPTVETTAIYRGWMMKPEQYAQFYEALQNNNIRLITTPESYELMHIFPNIYPRFGEDTARMMVYPDGEKPNVEEISRRFPRFMVKDFVKSVKGTEFPVYFDASFSQEAFDKWMEVFYHYRGELYTGGLCIKEYLPLMHYGTHVNEYRVFYIGNIVATVTRNSGQGNYPPVVPESITEKYRGFNSPFYTVEYAELENGTWKALEAGDGGVSGLSDGQDYNSFYRRLYYCLI